VPVDADDDVAAADLHRPDVLSELDEAGGVGEVDHALVVELRVLRLQREQLVQLLVGDAAVEHHGGSERGRAHDAACCSASRRTCQVSSTNSMTARVAL
jgi:hypothetical protein